MRVQAGDDDAEVDSLFELYPGTEAMEREAFDLFGDPLRAATPTSRGSSCPRSGRATRCARTTAVGRVPVQFKEAPGPR